MIVYEGYEPDCFELNDWILNSNPELYAATKYLSPSAQFQLWNEVWQQSGRPIIW